MYKILSSTGRLQGVTEVIPTVEAVVEFNGRKKRFVEKVTKTTVEPNGLILVSNSKTRGLSLDNCREYIGNLSADKVKEIMKALLIQGYYDFSEMEYQKAERKKDVVLDGGKSLPYTSKITHDAYPDNIYLGERNGWDFTDEDDWTLDEEEVGAHILSNEDINDILFSYDPFDKDDLDDVIEDTDEDFFEIDDDEDDECGWGSNWDEEF